jgi:hypothetical protein
MEKLIPPDSKMNFEAQMLPGQNERRAACLWPGLYTRQEHSIHRHCWMGLITSIKRCHFWEQADLAVHGVQCIMIGRN